MRHDGLKTCLFVLSLLVCGGTLPASAQEGMDSAVEVDMSVLNAMQPAAGRDPYYKPLSRRSAVLTGERASGVAERMVQQPSQPQESAASAPNYYWPVDQERPARTITPQQVPAAQQPDSAPRIISYPVTVKQRSELVDPSLEKARYTGQHLVKDEPKKSFTPPLPDFKPVAISRKAAKAAKSGAPTPLHRPKAEAAAAQIVEDAKKQVAVQQKADVFRAEIKGPSGPAMPAVPAHKVYAEPIRAQDVDLAAADHREDALASRLVSPDRDKMINTIAAITARMKSIDEKSDRAVAPVPPTKPDITRKVAVNSAEQLIDLTNIEPAAGLDVAARQPVIDITEDLSDTSLTSVPSLPEKSESSAAVPRMPPQDMQAQYEQEYVSLPFPAEADSLDDPTAAKLVRDVLPLLKDNPDWRVQIQAFATNADEKLKGARRISLSRALSIRSYLLEQGIEARRMDVRALGMQTDRQPADRVDFVFFDPNLTQ